MFGAFYFDELDSDDEVPEQEQRRCFSVFFHPLTQSCWNATCYSAIFQENDFAPQMGYQSAKPLKQLIEASLANFICEANFVPKHNDKLNRNQAFNVSYFYRVFRFQHKSDISVQY